MTRLDLDIVDYPGEWLLDLTLLRLDYAEWSAGPRAVPRGKPEGGRAVARGSPR